MGKAEIQIDADLLKQAEAAGVSAAVVAEEALRSAIRKADTAAADERAARWAADNAEAIEEYNQRILARGVFSNGVRTW